MKTELIGELTKIIADDGLELYQIENPSIYGKVFFLGKNDSPENYLERIETDESSILPPPPPTNYMWHDVTCNIQILMTYEQNLRLLNDYPEFGVYRKENNLNTIVDGGYVYTYVNYVLDVHKMLLTAYGAVINNFY